MHSLDQTPRREEAALDQTGALLLQRFAQGCSTVTFCAGDWQRLYHLTLDMHRYGLKTHPHTMRDYLTSRGCSLQKASWVSAHYQHFSELLSLYDQLKSSSP